MTTTIDKYCEKIPTLKNLFHVEVLKLAMKNLAMKPFY